MQQWLLLPTLALVCWMLSPAGVLAVSGRGAKLAKTSEFPYLGVLHIRSVIGLIRACDVVLIEKDWVATATHCLMGGVGYANNMTVSFRRPRVTMLEKDRPELIKRYDVREAFAPSVKQAEELNVGGDVMLLQLDESVTGIEPIRWRTPTTLSIHSELIIPGFGRKMTTHLHQIHAIWSNKRLKYTTLSLDTQCRTYTPAQAQTLAKINAKDPSVAKNYILGRAVLENGSQQYSDALYVETPRHAVVSKGDSGGPMIVRDAAGRDHLVGIVSKGRESCIQLASINSYLSWMDLVVEAGRWNKEAELGAEIPPQFEEVLKDVRGVRYPKTYWQILKDGNGVGNTKNPLHERFGAVKLSSLMRSADKLWPLKRILKWVLLPFQLPILSGALKSYYTKPKQDPTE